MTTTATTATATSFEKGSWQDSLNKSALLLDKSATARKTAGKLLWNGAKSGIAQWDSETDASAEIFAADVLAILGSGRKGDASKIKTVALAVAGNGLDLDEYENLSKAYAAAIALTKTVKVEAEEDDAAEQAIATIEAPKTASTPEAAAKVLLSKGVDGAVVAILDALGADNEAAHRAFLRAVSTEMGARVKAAKDAIAEATKAERDKAAAVKQAERDAKAKEAAEKKAAAKAALKEKAAKAKPTATAAKAKPAAKATTATTKAKPVAAKAKPVPVTEPVHVGDDMPDSGVEDSVLDADDAAIDAADEAPVVVKKRPVPVKR